MKSLFLHRSERILRDLAKNVQAQVDFDKPTDRIFIRSIHGYNKEVKMEKEKI